ncbi:MAG: IniB N-terminal domain-containing protein [Mycobacterium sp.]
MNIIDWILDLFRSEDVARSFVAAPEQTLRDAGLAGVSGAQLASVASTAVPGLVLGAGDPIVGLQRAVSNQYGFAPATEYSPANNLLSPTFAPETNTDLLSNNDTSLLSPDQAAGANAQQGAFNLGFGDITFGDKTSNTATNGGVVVDGDNAGDIVSGDGAVLGDNNEVNNGDVLAGTGSNVAVGHSNIEDSGTTATGNGTVIKDNDAPVLNDVDASGGNGGGASAGSGGGLLGIGIGNSQGGNAGGGGIVINDASTNVASHNAVDTSAHTATQTDTSVDDHADSSAHQTTVTDNSDESSSLFDTSLGSHNDTSLDNSHELALASGNHLPGF